MDDRSLNLIALTVGLFTLTSLVTPALHLSPYLPAGGALILLGAIGVDTLAFQGQVTRAMRDRLVGRSVQEEERILRHEAGHFLLAHLHEIPITGYALDAWESLRQGQVGDGGVRFDLEQSLSGHLNAKLAGNLANSAGNVSGKLAGNVTQVSSHWVEAAAMVLMAGIAAEQMFYKQAIGGQNDREQLRTLFRALQIRALDAKQRERLAIREAQACLEQHRSAYDALVEKMQQRADVATCQAAIQATIQVEVQTSPQKQEADENPI